MEKGYPYTITTKTGSKYYSGTDSKVNIILYGSNGESDVIQLKDGNNKDPFETGQTDVFSVKTKDLGVLYKVKISHDNSGCCPGWYLSKIHVEDGKTARKYEFSCYRWLVKGKKCSTEAELTTFGLPVAKIDHLDDINRKKHNTEKYKSDGLFIRRGQHFRLVVHLARPYNKKEDSFSLALSTGKTPRAHNKSYVHIPLVKEFDDTALKWEFRIEKIDQKTLELDVSCPADVLVSKYQLTLEVDDLAVYTHDKPVYVLFNPWYEHDEVSMRDEEKVKEYVLKEHGFVYVGNSRWQTGRKWFFGQFDEVTVETVFRLLNDIPPSKRDTATNLSRRVSALVNSNDDDGILVGNWSGKYDDGKAPTFWASSPPIFASFTDEHTSVKYGQCWVFSALVTSVMRCLGIPCRPITTFNSAHDTEQNASHDIYLDEDGDEIDNMSSDSIWNFHCWNDAWMSRPDLPSGYGGWQAIDATPQELSKGLFQMGPASLRAVKEGDVDLAFDTRFVLAEVNSDVIMWQKDTKTDKWEAVKSIRTHVGKKISTKAVGSNDRHDITNQYKFEEGSILERAAVKKALAKSGNPSIKNMPRDVEMSLDIPDSVNIGQDIVVTVITKNTGVKALRLKVVVGGQVLRYNGVSKEKLTRIKKTVDLDVSHENKTEFVINAVHYLQYLNEESSLRIFATVKVSETGQIDSMNDIVEIKKPTLEFQDVPRYIKNGMELKTHVSVTNPLQIPLTECELALDGTLWKERLNLKKDSIPAGGTHKFPIVITVQGRLGSRSLLASFTSKELSGLYGDIKVRVVQ